MVERLGCQRVESPVWRRLYAVKVTEPRGTRCHCHTELRFVDLTIPVWLSRNPTVRCFLYGFIFPVGGRATTLYARRCSHAGRGQNATQILPCFLEQFNRRTVGVCCRARERNWCHRVSLSAMGRVSAAFMLTLTVETLFAVNNSR